VKPLRRIAVSAVGALGLGVAVAVAYAHPGQMGGGMGQPMTGGMSHGMRGAMGPGAMGGPTGPMAGQALMTPEERQALAEKMRNAATPEERQKLAEATRTEMEKRAKERGITLPEPRGPRGGMRPNAAPATQAPATDEHVH
jgi:Spy/CpxP family protein refolding chaperone